MGELDELLREPEGERMEWKRSLGELREAMRTVCAFLNGSGGVLLFGIRPDGRRLPSVGWHRDGFRAHRP